MASDSNSKPASDIWSAEKYGSKVAPFVALLTTKIVSWLDPKPDDEILDVGCGEGPLTAKIGAHVKRIVGIDASKNMIDDFQVKFPQIESRVVDCRYLKQEKDLASGNFTKVFSNAALHWILRDPTTREDFFQGCFDALKPGGLMVSESGALGNIAEVHAAIVLELINRGVSPQKARDASPWFFPSLETMRALVEGAGFKWIKGEVELRQTELTQEEGGGITGWVKLFGANFREELKSDAEWDDAVKNVVAALEGVGRRQHDQAFTVNYIRLRFVAQKPE